MPVNKSHPHEQNVLAFVEKLLLSGGQFLLKMSSWYAGTWPLFTGLPRNQGDHKHRFD